MTRQSRIAATVLWLLIFAASFGTRGAWDEALRGTWVAVGGEPGAVLLVDGERAVEIVVDPREHSAVHQAARFLAQDIAKITGVTPAIVGEPTGRSPSRLHLMTLGVREVPAEVGAEVIAGQWEAFRIVTLGQDVYLVGSNFRGTAFAVYTLSERLGVDPLYHWTGYTPERRNPLSMLPVDYTAGPPTFKYRGLFHDDEDILPRPLDPATGYPFIRGRVPDEWYERYFETALRLKMNMVAPYVRTTRDFAVQKMASDWGLYYTSHHYDTLLSNPYGFHHFGLASQRGVAGSFDWFANRDGVITYWRGGVLENRELDAIWPVGMRGTDDVPYAFPPSLSDEEKARLYQEIIDLQVAMVKELLPAGKEPVFHFTLYNEMLHLFRLGHIRLPEEVILVWDDNGDGIMRALPTEADRLRAARHGVYYHLAFFGATHKQTVHTVTPLRIAHQFRNIVDAGATEFVLVNVSELREFIMEARMIADIAWDAEGTLGRSNPAYAYVDWWSREYFGEAAEQAARAYHDYYRIMDSHDKVWWGTSRVTSLVAALRSRFAGQEYGLPAAADLNAMRERARQHEQALSRIEQAMAAMTDEERQFFFEHVAFGLLIDYRPIQAALTLAEALAEESLAGAFAKVLEAFRHLQRLEEEIKKAERPPFEDWYRATWIRPSDYVRSPGNSNMNPHKSFWVVRDFLIEVGGFELVEPEDGAKVTGTVVLRFDTADPHLPVSHVEVTVGGETLYSGPEVPRELGFDSTVYPDGPLHVEVAAASADTGLTFGRSILLSVSNYWTLLDPLHAPVTTWFGPLHEEKMLWKSEGWVYVQGEEETFFRDESRLVRRTDTTERIVWEGRKLRDVQVTVYARGANVEDALFLEASEDGEAWRDLPYTLTRAGVSGEWVKYVARAETSGGPEVHYFRLTLTEGVMPFDAVQIGEVLLRGSNL